MFRPSMSPSSGPLPPDAIDAVHQWTMQVAVDLVFYGVQTALFLAAMAALARQPTRSILLQTPIVILFLTSTMGAIAILIFYTIQVPMFGAVPPDIDHEIFQLSIVLSVTDRVNYLLSDLIVVWRAWVLWPDNKLARAALAVCMCGSTVGLLIEVVWAFRDYGVLEPATHSLLMTVPLLVTNMVCTILMAARCWYYRRDIKSSLGNSNRTRIESILLILVESGFVYCGLWIMFLILRQTSTSNAEAYGVVKTAFHSLAGIYPTFIVLAVAGQRSAADSTIFTSAPVTHPIDFAPSDGAGDGSRVSGGRGRGEYTTTGELTDDETWASAGGTSTSGDGSTQIASEIIKLERRKKGSDYLKVGGQGSSYGGPRSSFGGDGSTFVGSSSYGGGRSRHTQFEDG
ncbi:hypothetical protein K525DRAFT_243163 [Schizophyllum commune Loenen D]|nr:hypothetical protein K525DRAFT_243163 [Schizophyllum commune Loenen D]